MNRTFLEYYRCPDKYADFGLSGQLSEDRGYFRCGKDTILYGRSTTGVRSNLASDALYDACDKVVLQGTSVALPFDPTEVVENLRRERYSAHFREAGRLSNAVIRKIYYLLRPYLSVGMLKHLQRIHLRKWNKIPFPAWPIDTTVDRLHRMMMGSAIKAQGLQEIPFIWFWPDDYTSCTIVTHDVESVLGRDFSDHLMDIDESFSFHSSFQVVPECRYEVPDSYLAKIRSRGFEVNVHDLKHDGRLYAEYDEFARRAEQINRYGRSFDARGFRSGILYRNADWYDSFDFLYDMSIPNVAHLDPQRGGCCTVMPYLIGEMIELPVTCTQDYTLFHMLGDYSIDLWKRQIELIRANHGMVSILVHPDYVLEPRAQNTYKALLQHLAELRDADHMWTPLPKDVAVWWRQRNEMKLVCEGGQWRVEGPGSERARVAFASAGDDGVTYRVPSDAPNSNNVPKLGNGYARDI
jgi:hypothetical protein